jgi:outer membrane protein OmpA-like peptidoglycan-associated protein
LTTVQAGEPDLEGSKDHPALSRLQGYYISSYNVWDFDAMEVEFSDGTTKSVEGKRTYITYNINEGVPRKSSLQIAKNYEQALGKLGGKMVGNNGLAYFIKAAVNTGHLWVKVYPYNDGDTYELNIVETKEMEQEVTLDVTSIANGIASTGRIAIYGIYFDNGKFDIKPESEPALKEIARYIKENPSISLHVVGHTDKVGNFDSNMKLSRDRADAVVKALVSRYSVAASRLKPSGVASLAPVASNADEAGRARNRRVELVEQ